MRYDRKAIETYILNHIDLSNYGVYPKSDRERIACMFKIFKKEYKEHILRDGITMAFEDYIMSIPSVFVIDVSNYDIINLLRLWNIEFDEDDEEIYLLYKKIIREVFFSMVLEF